MSVDTLHKGDTEDDDDDDDDDNNNNNNTYYYVLSHSKIFPLQPLTNH